MLHRKIFPPLRRALTTAETAALIASIGSGVGVVGVATMRMIIGPGSASAETIEAPDEMRMVIKALDEIVADAEATMFVSRGEDSSVTSIALWIHDTVDPGHVNVSEVLILDHSPLLESLSTLMYQREEDSILPGDSFIPERVGILSSLSDVQGFRALPDVHAVVIAVGVKRMEIDTDASVSAGSADGDDEVERGMRLRLTWGGESADSTPVMFAVPTPLPALRP